MITKPVINEIVPREVPMESISFGPFSEGMCTSLPEYGLTPNQFSVISNYEIELNGLLRVRKGYWPYDVASAESILTGSPVSMFVGDRNGSDVVLAQTDTGATDTVKSWDGTAWRDIKTGLTTDKFVEFLKYTVNEAEDILFYNGEDTPQRWSGINETEAITGGTKGATTVYTVASTTGMVVGRCLTVSGCTITDYNVTQVITAVVADTSVTTDLVSTGFSGDPADGTITVRGSDDMGLAIPTDTHFTITAITKANPAVVTATGDVTPYLSVGDKFFITGVAADSQYNTVHTIAGISYSAPSTTITTATNSAAYASAGADGTVHVIAIGESSAATASGRGITVNGDYYYKYTYFYDDSGETTKYGESGPGIPAGHQVAVSGAAEATPQKVTIYNWELPAGVSKVGIYRSPADSAEGPFRFIGWMESTDTSYEDNTPNGEEGVLVSIFDSVMPVLKHATIAGGRIVAIDGDLPSKVIWSESGYPDVFPALNYAYLPEAGTGVATFNGNVFAFTKNNVYMLAGADFENGNFIKICDKGCISHRTIQDIGNGLIWLGQDNIYWADFNTQAADGDFPIPIGEPIRDTIDNIPPAYAHVARSAYTDNRYYISIPGASQEENTQTWVLNTIHGVHLTLQGKMGGWTTLDWNAADMAVYNKVLYTLDTGNLYVMEHNSPYAKDVLNYTNYGTTTHQSISTAIETGWLALGSEWAYKIAHSVSLAAESTGVEFTAQASLRDENNNEIVKTARMTLGNDNIVVENNWLLWDVGSWAWDDSESGEPGYDADAGQNWAADGRGMYAVHKRFKKGGKGLVARFGLYADNSLDARIVQMKDYYRVSRKAI